MERGLFDRAAAAVRGGGKLTDGPGVERAGSPRDARHLRLLGAGTRRPVRAALFRRTAVAPDYGLTRGAGVCRLVMRLQRASRCGGWNKILRKPQIPRIVHRGGTISTYRTILIKCCLSQKCSSGVRAMPFPAA